eukprot:sb/3473165/
MDGWVLPDGTQTTYVNWGSNEPNVIAERCVLLCNGIWYNTQWIDIPCDYSAGDATTCSCEFHTPISVSTGATHGILTKICIITYPSAAGRILVVITGVESGTSYYILSKLCNRDHLATIALARAIIRGTWEISLPVAVGYQGEIQFCTCIRLLLS